MTQTAWIAGLAVLVGLVAGGLVWFMWSAGENVLAILKRKPSAEPKPASTAEAEKK